MLSFIAINQLLKSDSVSSECLVRHSLIAQLYQAQLSLNVTWSMTQRCIVPEEFLILSDSISLSQPQSQQGRTVSFRQFTFRMSFSQTQFQELINWIQDLETWIFNYTTGRPVTVLNPFNERDFRILSHATERPASVLNPLTEHDFRISNHATERSASVLNSFTELSSLPSVSASASLLSESVRGINDESDWVKANPPFTFNSSDDIQLWILEINDYFNLQRITDLNAQVTVTCFYLSDTLHQCTQRLRLAEDVEPFSMWDKLQSWLLTNYSLSDASLKADLAMNKLSMKHKEIIQSFINWFKTVVAELKWNEPVITAAFRRKLNTEISETIHFLQSAEWSKTFADFKHVTQQAENHLCISKCNQKDWQAELSVKWLQFDLLSNCNEYHWDEWETHKLSLFHKWAVNLRTTALNSLLISEEAQTHLKEKHHCRELRHCLNCEDSGHWADKCTSLCNLSEESTVSKNA